MTRTIKGSVVIVLLVIAAIFVIGSRRPATATVNDASLFSPNIDLQSQDGEKTAEEVYKNIQVLKGLPASQVNSVMNFMRVSLGARCEDCHVRDGNTWAFEKDDKPAKRTGREMIRMVLNINKDNFGGRTQVTCNTCHRGQMRPVAIPSEAQIKESQDRVATEKAVTGTTEQLPSVDQVIDKYIQDLGGKSAMDNLWNRFAKGTYTTHTTTLPLEMYQAAPNKSAVVVTTPTGTLTQIFNGSSGWFISGKDKREIKGAALEDLKQHSNLFPYANLKDQYQNLRVLRKDKIGSHDVYVIVGTAASDKRRQTFYFDVQSGLLLRVSSAIGTMMGNLPLTLDYDDYREVDGVRIPFTRHNSELDGFNAETIKLTEVKHKIAIDDSRFNPGNF